MKSMTGFGSSRANEKAIELDISIRSINGRFLDCRFHLPKEYVPFEGELKKVLASRFERGVLDIYVNRRVASEVSRSVKVQKPALRQWLKALEEIAKEQGIKKSKSELSPVDLAALPEVVVIEDSGGLHPHEKKMLIKALESAAKACEQARDKEGDALKKEILKWVHSLEKLTEDILKLSQQASQDLKKRLEDKWRHAKPDVNIEEQRLAQEVVFYLDKGDVSEEIARLKMHLKNFKDLCSARESTGKKLDFYTQELLREVNTIGSKSSQPMLTGLVVDAKSNVEKIREQVQNVE